MTTYKPTRDEYNAVMAHVKDDDTTRGDVLNAIRAFGRPVETMGDVRDCARAAEALKAQRAGLTTTSDAVLNQPSYAFDNGPLGDKRYRVQAYKLRGEQRFKIVDTFNGGKIVAKGFVVVSHAMLRRDELNAKAVR